MMASIISLYSSKYFQVQQLILLTDKMENFCQLLWTSDSSIIGDIPELDSSWEAIAYPDVDVSYSDLSMADYPPPSPLKRREQSLLCRP